MEMEPSATTAANSHARRQIELLRSAIASVRGGARAPVLHAPYPTSSGRAPPFSRYPRGGGGGSVHRTLDLRKKPNTSEVSSATTSKAEPARPPSINSTQAPTSTAPKSTSAALPILPVAAGAAPAPPLAAAPANLPPTRSRLSQNRSLIVVRPPATAANGEGSGASLATAAGVGGAAGPGASAGFVRKGNKLVRVGAPTAARTTRPSKRLAPSKIKQSRKATVGKSMKLVLVDGVPFSVDNRRRRLVRVTDAARLSKLQLGRTLKTNRDEVVRSCMCDWTREHQCVEHSRRKVIAFLEQDAATGTFSLAPSLKPSGTTERQSLRGVGRGLSKPLRSKGGLDAGSNADGGHSDEEDADIGEAEQLEGLPLRPDFSGAPTLEWSDLGDDDDDDDDNDDDSTDEFNEDNTEGDDDSAFDDEMSEQQSAEDDSDAGGNRVVERPEASEEWLGFEDGGEEKVGEEAEGGWEGDDLLAF
ncbi:hypothetical protein HK405_003709 [Cladochytrium tenue]|nr:hypothetical protein HK405_003709 [Cladochytrium tenue]